jgi:hypothetical protein
MDVIEALQFVKTRDAVEAVVERIGYHTTHLILVAADGEWLRFVLPSPESAERLAKGLKVETHEGWPDHLRQKVASYKRAPADWRDAPYPERYRQSSV